MAAATLDYGKLYQSLHSGYEFLCTLENVTINGNEITFHELKSDVYNKLFDRLQTHLARTMSPEELNTVLFHEAVHFTRMLTYRAAINPKTVCAFFAVATRLFEDFLIYYSNLSWDKDQENGPHTGDSYARG